MVWSHSLYIGQDLHKSILLRAGLSEERMVRMLTGMTKYEIIDDFEFGISIDVYFSFFQKQQFVDN